MIDKPRQYARATLAIVESTGLLIITLATIVAMYQEVMVMVNAGRVALADLLLMFLYLEVLTMVGLYYQSGKLPVRFPLYIAIVALARYIILDVKEMTEWRLLAVSASILVVAMGVLLIRYGDLRLAYPAEETPPVPGGEIKKPSDGG